MEQLLQTVKQLNEVLWGGPMLFLLMGTHIFFTLRLKFIQRKTWKAIRLSVEPDEQTDGDLSSFATLTTTLAATLGTGNIIGVSTAVALGGPGAVLWCWLTGLFGMATSYAECYLGFLYRKRTKDGSYIGGPMYVLQDGLGSKGMAVIFCIGTLFASYGVGCTTQSNSITSTAESLWGLPPMTVGFITALLCGLVIVGGIKSIGKICVKLVPSMGAFYIIGCFIILYINRDFIIPSILHIVESAFTPQAATGGFIGSTMMSAARYGVARGLFTNEAGLGSAAIAAASAKTKDPKKQALVSMTATFWDTVVMCAVTGLVIISNIMRLPDSIQGLNNGELTTAAFMQIPYIGQNMLGISLIAFAIATLFGWSYFGEKAVDYLFGKKGINTYRVVYIVMIFVGGVMSLDLVWEMSDLINIFMAIPSLTALLLLYKKIKV